MHAPSKPWIAAPLLVAALPILVAGKDELPARFGVRFQGLSENQLNVTVRFQLVERRQAEPNEGLPAMDVVISEDGKEVARVPVQQEADPIAVVLAMDTSGSMTKQNNISRARDAGTRFLTKLDPKTPAGLVLFHHEPYLKEAVSPDKGRLRSLVEQAQAKGGTAFIDATGEALELLNRSDLPPQRAIVLMTDGRDTNSRQSLAAVIQKAQERKVRVYTLGLGQPGRNQWVRTVLVLARSGSMKEGEKIPALMAAATRFVQLLPLENADTTIETFSTEVQPARDFTRQKAGLQQVVDTLKFEGETALYDATYQAIETLLAGREPGADRREAVVVLTDGKDTDSRRRDTDAIELAGKAKVRVFMLGLGDKGQLNEPAMTRIAEETGGKYFHAQDQKRLVEIFEELSINLHDEGIDEASLQKLAKETGGKYYHIRQADELGTIFEQVAGQLQPHFTVTFRSGRRVHDGTERGIELTLVNRKSGQTLAVAEQGYVVHGLISPVADHVLYLGLLLVLLTLLGAPPLIRRLHRFYSGAAS